MIDVFLPRSATRFRGHLEFWSIIRHKFSKTIVVSRFIAIADIALQVWLSSHLTQQFKRFTGMAPKQLCPNHENLNNTPKIDINCGRIIMVNNKQNCRRTSK